MKNVGWAALIGAGVALVAFLVDWALDHLDTPEEPEPLWPASKPYSQVTHWSVGDAVVSSVAQAEFPDHWTAEYHYRMVEPVDRNFLNPTPETWKLP